VKNLNLPVDNKEWKALEILLEKKKLSGAEGWCAENNAIYREDFRHAKSVYLTCRVCKYRVFRFRGGSYEKLGFASRQ